MCFFPFSDRPVCRSVAWHVMPCCHVSCGVVVWVVGWTDEQQIDEYGRMVYEGQPEKPPPIRDEDRAPFWEGLGDKISDRLNEFEDEEVRTVGGSFVCRSCKLDSCELPMFPDVPFTLMQRLGMGWHATWWWKRRRAGR